jgi:acyl carrier protein
MSELQNSPGGGSPQERVMALVARILEHPHGAALPVDVRLNELGMSSMKMINLMLAIEVELDLTIPQTEITPDNFQSIASVAAMVGRLLGVAGSVSGG